MKKKFGRYGEHFHSAHVAKKIAPHDVLGRAVLAVSQTRHLGTANKGFSGVCTAYDAASRPVRVSEPFFLTSLASDSEPTSFAGTVCTSARSWNTTTYDALGRVTQVQRADGTGNTQSYSGLTTTTWDANGHASSQSVNALGEVVTSTDGAGLALSFTYRADGQIATVSRNAGRGAVDTSFVYDVLGRKLSQTDRDTGTTSYQYNALGEVIVQIDSANHRIERHLDARGRLWRERSYRWGGGGHSLESTRQFVFDTLARGAVTSDAISGSTGNQSRSYSYDGLARLIQRDTSVDGYTYREQTQYDTRGRAWKNRDATGLWLKQSYDARGFATRLCDSTEADTASACGASFYTTVEEVDARGAVLKERRGSTGGPTIGRSYNALNGQLVGVCTGAGCSVQNALYGYDNKGQLTAREEVGRYREHFQYDGADRLTLGWFSYRGSSQYPVYPPTVDPDGAMPANLSAYAQYDALGNLCRKAAFGLFVQYGYAGRAGCGVAGLGGSAGTSAYLSAHQAQSIFIPGLVTLTNQHDVRGNMTVAGDERYYDYSVLNQPLSVHQGSPYAPTERSRFAYGADGARYRRIDDGSNQSAVTTIIIGAVEIRHSSGSTRWRRSIGGVALAEYSDRIVSGGISRAGSLAALRHQFTDRLGSVQVIGLISGASIIVQERLDLDAWGEWRIPDPPFGRNGSNYTQRGFTGHEHLTGQDTIHMNGRLYWPSGGRMVQADPIITDPLNPQNWNPYSYVINNPLNLTDPSGYSFIDYLLNPLKNVTRSVMRALGPEISGVAIGVGCAAVPGPWSIACAAGAGYDHARAFGADSASARRSGVASAFTALVSWRLQTSGANLHDGSRWAIASSASGVASVIQGGKFGHGFASAGMTMLVSPYVHRIPNNVAGSVVAAIVGGSVSQMTGGKFANGAVSGAFGYAFSSAASRIQGEGSVAPSADEGVSPSRALRRRMVLTRGEGTQDMRITLTISPEGVDTTAAQTYVDTANGGWNVSIVGDDGITRTFGLDLTLVARRGNLRLLLCEPSVCSTGRGAADVGGPRIWYSPAGRSDTPVHELGHVFGFSSNRAYGTGSIMSGDWSRRVTQRDFDLLWRAYRGR